MLQQTTVAAVVPFFDRFLNAFPDVSTLASADEAEVLKLWEGLGYYRRARHLHATAKRIVADHDGRFPDDPVAWAEFPGVGRYILGAVLSQAFERRLPIVETNSLRVLTRLFGESRDPRDGDGKAWVWKAAEAVLPRTRIGDFNQALMELGALVCSPRKPDCANCPLAHNCTARARGLQETIPPIRSTREPVKIREAAVAIHAKGRYLVRRRPAEATRWANLWEFPHGEWPANETLDQIAIRIARESTGLAVEFEEELATIRHGVTRFSIVMTGVRVRKLSGTAKSKDSAELRWVDPRALADLPTSTPQRKLFQLVANPPAARLF
jgi:A/G-specific adenine glycosylase